MVTNNEIALYNMFDFMRKMGCPLSSKSFICFQISVIQQVVLWRLTNEK